MRIGLKVDVATLRGTREGVPALVEVFGRCGVAATFLFALGPDHTGRALRRVLRGTLVGKVPTPSPVRHFGVRSMLYGTLLPGPDIARRGRGIMRSVREAGHETGVHCYDLVRWQDEIAAADLFWTEREMTRACERYVDVFKEPPRTHGAAGWQMNVHALRLTQRLGFEYCSDGWGRCPYLPVCRAELIRCPQLPTTLPTFDALIGEAGIGAADVARHMLEATSDPTAADHVFTMRAEIDGMLLAPMLEELIEGWKAQGWQVGPLRSIVEATEPLDLPRCEVDLAGGNVLAQGEEFLAAFAIAEAA